MSSRAPTISRYKTQVLLDGWGRDQDLQAKTNQKCVYRRNGGAIWVQRCPTAVCPPHNWSLGYEASHGAGGNNRVPGTLKQARQQMCRPEYHGNTLQIICKVNLLEAAPREAAVRLEHASETQGIWQRNLRKWVTKASAAVFFRGPRAVFWPF
jgi:hypothetical protein